MLGSSLCHLLSSLFFEGVGLGSLLLLYPVLFLGLHFSLHAFFFLELLLEGTLLLRDSFLLNSALLGELLFFGELFLLETLFDAAQLCFANLQLFSLSLDLLLDAGLLFLELLFLSCQLFFLEPGGGCDHFLGLHDAVAGLRIHESAGAVGLVQGVARVAQI